MSRYSSATAHESFPINHSVETIETFHSDHSSAPGSETMFFREQDFSSDTHFRTTAAAKPHSLYQQAQTATPVQAPVSAFYFESPSMPQAHSFFPTPPSVLGFHDQFVSPEAGAASRRASIAASQLSFNEPLIPYTEAIPPSSRQVSVASHNVESPQLGSSHQYSNPEMGSGIHDTSPTTTYCSSLNSQTKSSNLEKENISLEDILKEDPFAEVKSPDNWSLDFARCEEELDGFASQQKKPNPAHISTESDQVPNAFLTSQPPSSISTPTKSSSFAPKKVRKAKSFTSGSLRSSSGSTFSLEDCSNEFHVTEGRIAFEDETARVFMQLGNSAVTKKRSYSSKLPQSFQALRKSKTSTSLCSRSVSSSNKHVFRDMESGLVSFQLQLNTENAE